MACAEVLATTHLEIPLALRHVVQETLLSACMHAHQKWKAHTGEQAFLSWSHSYISFVAATCVHTLDTTTNGTIHENVCAGKFIY